MPDSTPTTTPKDGGLTIPPTISTPRLLLKRMNDTTSPQQANWFHRFWTDDDCTTWSVQGKTTSPEDSLERMKQHNDKFDMITFAVFAKDVPPEEGYPDDPGRLVGNIGLRRLKATLPPFPREESAGASGGKENEGEGRKKRLDVRSLGYAYFSHAWGKGYATEAGKAVLDTYEAAVKEKLASSSDSEEEEVEYWVEAGWDKDNPASGNVIAKLGFKEVGWYVEETDELIFLGGKWRGPGYWIWGKWVG
ncbi:hypothetical protein DM02DRAFT_1623 [Periconia macrospinosa]|uniref:N-acetyltransferase domain-containing protein n=1 Tax=Periconia macrospinosa TaxID=97972 RepID=A0A2V1ECL8_9PLEO|nr:hypothetical protein DM02DRAFT_1623 [Periconia macrospinosa]